MLVDVDIKYLYNCYGVYVTVYGCKKSLEQEW